MRERPRAAGEIQIEIPYGSNAPPISATDLDGVLRMILWDLMQEREWITTDGRPNFSLAARELGLKQRTLHDFLRQKDPKGTSLWVLSHICRALGVTPSELFARHELYRPEISEPIDRAAYDALHAVFTAQQARRLYRVALALRARQALDSWLASAEATLQIDPGNRTPIPPDPTGPVNIQDVRPRKKRRTR